MLLLDKIGDTPIILGSQSPRRRELLASLDIRFEVEVREVEEVLPNGIDAALAAEYLAVKKVKAFNEVSLLNKIIITADTVVVDQNQRVLGKPANMVEAKQVLMQLSGREHVVYTGVAIAYQGAVRRFTSATKVNFRVLLDEEIDYYLAKYNPLDKAGSYGIQEWIGRMGVAYIEGSFENVMGLPTSRLYEELQDMFK